MAKDGDLKGFTVAGADGKFVSATAIIEGGQSRRLQPRSVAKPVAVRYGWVMDAGRESIQQGRVAGYAVPHGCEVEGGQGTGAWRCPGWGGGP